MAKKKVNAPTPEAIAEAEVQIQERQKGIDYYITEYTIEILAAKMRAGELFVPEYQRKFTWEPQRKWRFIESLLMGLPIPFFFFWENPETGIPEIVDGSQRLRTIEEFILGDLRLGELSKLPALKGFRFSDLVEARQRKLKNRSIRGIVLKETTDVEARLDLFERINTSSKAANPAEVRRGALKGPFMKLVVELAELPAFKLLAPAREQRSAEREHEELATRFFAWSDGIPNDLPGYRDEPRVYIFNYAKAMNAQMTADPSLIAKYRERMEATLSFIARTFPDGFRKASTAQSTPRARFDAIAVGSYLALARVPDLVVSAEDATALIESEAFKEWTVSDAANVKSKLVGRIACVRDGLLRGTT